MLSMVVQIALGLIYFGSSAAFNAFSGVGVICLTTSYAMPIAVSLLNKREAIKDASFHLGKLGLVCNYISLGTFFSSLHSLELVFAVPSSVPEEKGFGCFRPFVANSSATIQAWSLLAIPLFCMPTVIPVAATSMNYASVVFVGFTVIAGGWYIAWGHKNYSGPPT